MPGTNTGWYRRFGKRTLDIALGLVLLIISLPFQAVIAYVVALKLGRPVIFRQDRPGKDGRIFTLSKFRTMRPPSEASNNPTDDAERMTPFGRKLRSTSLDELPELLGIVRGDLSLVGPRPLLVEYLTRYSPAQARRHEVRPGLTGWAQVNGRNAVDWQQRFELDVWYVDNLSLKLDLKILWRTISAVFRRDGVSQEGQETMLPFEGNGNEVFD